MNDAARESALSLLDGRDFPSGQLVERLVRRGHDEQDARDAVAGLARAGIVDDRRYAARVAESILARGPASAEYLAARLAGRGIAAGVAREVADATLAGMDIVEDAAVFCRRRVRERDRGPAAARRLAACLARRGLDDDTIRSALGRVLEESP